MNSYVQMILRLAEDHLSEEEKLYTCEKMRGTQGRTDNKNSSKDCFNGIIEALTFHDAHNTMMTVEECAAFLRVHKNTVTNRIHAGDIQATFLGRIWRIPKIQFLEQILENHYAKNE